MLAGTGEEAQALAESQRFGVLLLLERLTPVQRAVFVLRELLDCEYDEVAAATGRSAATCRQVFLRARARLGEELPARGLPRAQAEAVVGDSLGALAARDLPRLSALLTEDAVAISDHGGKAQAAQRSVHGADRVARLIQGLAKKGSQPPNNVTFAVTRMGGGLGLVGHIGEVAIAVVGFEVRGDRIAAVHFVRNPDKLRHLHRPAVGAA